MNLEKVNETIDKRGRVIVGVALKRLELLKDVNLSHEERKSLYKELLKNVVYEQLRVLKDQIKLLNAPTIRIRK